MNLQWTEIDDIVVELEMTYNVTSNNYINKLPLWVTQALANYKVFIPMEAAVVELPIENGDMVVIPNDVKGLSALSYNSMFASCGTTYKGFNRVPHSTYNDMLDVTGFQKEIVQDEEGNIISSRKVDVPIPITKDLSNVPLTYFVNNSRVLTVDFGEDGELVKLYYLRLPHSRDSKTGAYLPMIPDNEVVKQNITWFILRNLLYSGYSHPVLNLGHAMPYMNPAKMYDDTLPSARSQFLKSDRADYGKYKNLFTTLVHSYNDPSANLQQH